MAAKPTGISRDLIIHPGETIADVLAERGMTQAELAARCGVSAAYVSAVIAGRKDISASFAAKLEYALGVEKAFWLNLQANYDAELMEFAEKDSVTQEERDVRKAIASTEEYLAAHGEIPQEEETDQRILTLRRYFRVSNLCCLKNLLSPDVEKLSETVSVNPYLLAALIQLGRT